MTESTNEFLQGVAQSMLDGVDVPDSYGDKLSFYAGCSVAGILLKLKADMEKQLPLLTPCKNCTSFASKCLTYWEIPGNVRMKQLNQGHQFCPNWILKED